MYRTHIYIAMFIIALVLNGCNGISIPPYDGSDLNHLNPNSPNDFSCHLFHPNGGGISEQFPDEQWLDSEQKANGFYGKYLYHGIGGFKNIGTTCQNSSCADLVFFVPNIKLGLCSAIRVKSGLSEASTSFSIYHHNPVAGTHSYFQGEYEYHHPASVTTANESQYSGCIGGLPQFGKNTYFHVLLPR